MADVSLEMLLAMTQRVLDSQRDVAAELRELKARMTDVERQLGRNGAAEIEHFASVMGRMDRFDERLGRVERRLDLSDA